MDAGSGERVGAVHRRARWPGRRGRHDGDPAKLGIQHDRSIVSHLGILPDLTTVGDVKGRNLSSLVAKRQRRGMP